MIPQAKPLVLEFHVDPKPKQSVRFGKGRAYTSPVKRQWVQDVALLAQAQYHGQPLEGPLIAEIEWRFRAQRKRDIGTHKHTRPDLDNLMKPLGDALAGIVFNDDAQIVEHDRTRKVWAAEPGITVKVWSA